MARLKKGYIFVYSAGSEKGRTGFPIYKKVTVELIRAVEKKLEKITKAENHYVITGYYEVWGDGLKCWSEVEDNE